MLTCRHWETTSILFLRVSLFHKLKKQVHLIQNFNNFYNALNSYVYKKYIVFVHITSAVLQGAVESGA